MGQFDFVIVGAGSAGCVLANRLSADKANRVALLEAGGPDRSLLVRMPAGVSKLIRAKGPFNWGFWTVPQKHLDGRRLWQPRGRGWGGSSSINGMIYTRGHARDYDQWRRMGLDGWGYRDVLPYFKRAETNEDGGDEWRGDNGPLHVSTAPFDEPIYGAFVAAGAAAGYKTTRDFNGPQQEGFGPYHLTIKDGERQSASAAYLRPALRRDNLEIISHARAARILIENGKAIGVEYVKDGKRAQAFADAEVILSGGALLTPQLLMLSGIGPADHLKSHGIPVICDQPEVGENLQDHLDVSLIYENTQPVSVYAKTKGYRNALAGLDYMVRKAGPARTNHLHAGAFLKSRGERDRPDIQLHFVNAVMIDHAKVKPDRDGFTIHACGLHPQSKGSVRLVSSDPLADPEVDPNYLEAESDRNTLRDAVRMVRDIVGREPLAPFRGPEMAPGASIVGDADIDAWIRRSAETIYHPVGTVRMGADAHAPLDAALKLRGVENLRVVDASVMPAQIGGNTNAPVIMIAEKISDAILGKAPLPPIDAAIAEDG